MSMIPIEQLILTGILHSGAFRSKAYPHIEPELFSSTSTPAIVEIIKKYHNDYDRFPSRDALLVELDNHPGLSEDLYNTIKGDIQTLTSESAEASISKLDMAWFFDKAEQYLKSQSCHLAVLESLTILDGESKNLTADAIPDILKKALSISFDTDLGHDYFTDAASRYDFYNQQDTRIPFRLKALNDVTGGGIPRKTLTVPVAPTGVGKSLFLTDWASYLITEGYNVLYVTLELAEERVAERVDANLMDVTMGELKIMSRDVFENNINTIKRRALGILKINEYPPGTFHANHLRFLLQDYENKQGFKPDVVMVDYLNLMSSYRMKDASNSYSYIKAVTEEIRGVAMEADVTVVSPTQTNRSAFGEADFGMDAISESAGVVMTADVCFAMISTDELVELNHLRIKQLKNRFGDINKPSSFVVNVNRAKMQIRDLDDVSKVVAKAQRPTHEALNTKMKATFGEMKF